MKGLILCGGVGSRLRPLTFSRPKHLLPLMNKPVLFYGIEAMIQAGIKEIAVVVSPSYRKVFDEALQGGAPWNIAISLIEQQEPKGLADAVRAAEPFIQQDDFLLYLGDNVIDGSLLPLIHKFQTENLDGLVSVSSVEAPERFGVVQLDGEKIEKVVEKPKNPPSNLAINGVYLFRHTLFGAISKIHPSARGEYELTDAIQQLIDDHYQLGVFRSPYWWKDTGLPKDLITCNQYFLQKLDRISIKGTVDQESSISNSVVIGEHARIINSVIRGPVIIGEHAIIENSYIGPYSSISNHVSIYNCELENSIVMENTLLDCIPHRIDESLIGGEVKMIGKSQQPQCIQLWVGDHSQIYFPR
ncbi:glucose-1-phosphate thymidylyltransferase [Paenibacillus eucommiae]|uniref:Glucose-1-phosphate thymidylyltransferase n=1 Tax=Paenibacillus eucommiae TaxID=1355755 RepID=A0ABS4IV68_9BACL|nr:glucose-1-phosphate thymidylyltransferase [Paenibacillus eucommiae]MBP1990985.1 glucose-1-phosphate thymidylyltransferase [Paenibacillus eucommiae]